jgi:hypothetical protein
MRAFIISRCCICDVYTPPPTHATAGTAWKIVICAAIKYHIKIETKRLGRCAARHSRPIARHAAAQLLSQCFSRAVACVPRSLIRSGKPRTCTLLFRIEIARGRSVITRASSDTTSSSYLRRSCHIHEVHSRHSGLAHTPAPAAALEVAAAANGYAFLLICCLTPFANRLPVLLPPAACSPYNARALLASACRARSRAHVNSVLPSCCRCRECFHGGGKQRW